MTIKTTKNELKSIIRNEYIKILEADSSIELNELGKLLNKMGLSKQSPPQLAPAEEKPENMDQIGHELASAQWMAPGRSVDPDEITAKLPAIGAAKKPSQTQTMMKTADIVPGVRKPVRRRGLAEAQLRIIVSDMVKSGLKK